MILFDPVTARDLHVALTILRSRLRGTGKSLSPGAEEIFSLAERSLGVRGGHVVDGVDAPGEADYVISLLTYDEAAKRLRVSDSTVKRLVRSGDLTAVQIGSAARIRPADLDAYIDSLPTKETA